MLLDDCLPKFDVQTGYTIQSPHLRSTYASVIRSWRATFRLLSRRAAKQDARTQRQSLCSFWTARPFLEIRSLLFRSALLA